MVINRIGRYVLWMMTWVGVLGFPSVVVGQVVAQKSNVDEAAQSDELNELKQLIPQVMKLYTEGKYDEAIPLAVRVLTIIEKDIGPDTSGYALSLNNLARLYAAKGDYTRAAPL